MHYTKDIDYHSSSTSTRITPMTISAICVLLLQMLLRLILLLPMP